MSALEERHVEHARNRAVENRLCRLEAEVAANAKFRQKIQGALLVIVGLVSLAAGALSIARALQGFL